LAVSLLTLPELRNENTMHNELTNEGGVFLSTELAGRREIRLALAVVLISTIVFVAAVPFAKAPLGQFPAFIPIYVSALVSCDVITAVLLFSQFNVLRSRSLLVLGCGYLFTASISSSYLLMFPGVFSSTGLLDAGPQSTSAMYMFWHGGFGLAVIGYSVLKGAGTAAAASSRRPLANGRFAILSSAILVLCIAVGYTVLVTAGHEHLPVFIQGDHTTDLGRVSLLGGLMLGFLALVVLWRQRPHTLIDVWLIVVMCVWLFDIALSAILNTGRYDVGWYVGRIYGLLAASLLLVVLLIKNSNYYVHLVRVSAKLNETNRFLEQQSLRAADDLRRYRGLLEAAPDAMVVVNQSGDIVLLNLRAEKQFGYSRNALIGQQVTAIIPGGFAERLVADALRSTADALAQQIGTEIELSGRRRDGSEFPIEIMLSPLESAEGVLVTAAIRDISVRRDAEVHLAQMEGRYRGLLEAAPDAMVVVNQSGEIVLLNIRAEQQFGYSRDELVGQEVKTIIPEGFAERLLADERRSAPEALAQQIGMGIELYGRRRNGAEFPIEIMLSPLESAEGVLVTAAIRDISVRRNAEEHLAQMEGRYRGLLEAAPDAMVVVNQSGEIVLLNIRAEQQFGYSRDELIGQEVTNIIPEGFAERLLADGRRSAPEALAQQIGMGIELYGRRRDGAEFPIEIMLSPLESAEGILVTAAIRDISVRRDAERHLAKMEEGAQLARAQAEEANRAKSRFLAAVSHELRTPLNGILGYTQLLRIEGGLNTKQSERVNAMLGAGTHLLQMINSVLDLSEIEEGHIELQKAEFGLREVASACLDFVRPAAEAKKLALELVVAPNVPNLVTTDPIRLRQVLLNLLGNAVKFTIAGSVKLRVGLAADRASLRFEVVDTGPGIPAEHRHSLFQDFRRLEAHSTTLTEGAGLGLAIAASLTTLMGGHLGHEDNPAGGSVFWLELLVAGSAAASPPAPTEAPPAPDVQPVARSTRVLHLLVVDDIAMNRDIAGSFLQAAGHVVSFAEGGAEAVAAVLLTDFDAVLMDVRMPEVDGLEATRRIRSLDGSSSRVPIVALTAQAFTEQVKECRNAGMDGHVTKPFTPDTLLDAVMNAVQIRAGSEQDTPHGQSEAAAPRTQQTVPVSMPIPMQAPAFPDLDAEQPILDGEAFIRTAAFLSPEAVAGYLQFIFENGEALLSGLRDFGTQDPLALATAAHALAGSAGLLGFKRLVHTARRFEQAIQTASLELPSIIAALITTVDVSLHAVKRSMTATATATVS